MSGSVVQARIVDKAPVKERARGSSAEGGERPSRRSAHAAAEALGLGQPALPSANVVGWCVPRRFRLNDTAFDTWNREFSRGFVLSAPCIPRSNRQIRGGGNLSKLLCAAELIPLSIPRLLGGTGALFRTDVLIEEHTSNDRPEVTLSKEKRA